MGFHFTSILNRLLRDWNTTGCRRSFICHVRQQPPSPVCKHSRCRHLATTCVLPSIRTMKPTVLTTVGCLDFTLPLFFSFPMTGTAHCLDVFARCSCLLRPWMRCFLPHCDTALPFTFLRLHSCPALWRKCVHSPQLRLNLLVVWRQYTQICTEEKK